MIYQLDTDMLIFMIRGLKSTNRHQASRERAQEAGQDQQVLGQDNGTGQRGGGPGAGLARKCFLAGDGFLQFDPFDLRQRLR